MHAPFETHKPSRGKSCPRSGVSVSRAAVCAPASSRVFPLARRECSTRRAFATHHDRRGLGRHAAPVAPLQPSRFTVWASVAAGVSRLASASGKFQARHVAASGVRAVGFLQPISLPNPSVERDGQPAALVGSLRSFAAPAAPHLARYGSLRTYGINHFTR